MCVMCLFIVYPKLQLKFLRLHHNKIAICKKSKINRDLNLVCIKSTPNDTMWWRVFSNCSFIKVTLSVVHHVDNKCNSTWRTKIRELHDSKPHTMGRNILATQGQIFMQLFPSCPSPAALSHVMLKVEKMICIFPNSPALWPETPPVALW